MKAKRFKLAGNILLSIMLLFVILHVLILSGIVPHTIVWGGQIDDSGSNLVKMEIIAIVVMLLFMLIIAAKVGLVQADKYKNVVNVGTWIVAFYFLLNTFANIASFNAIENWVFAPLTIFMAFLSFRLAVDKKRNGQ